MSITSFLYVFCIVLNAIFLIFILSDNKFDGDDNRRFLRYLTFLLILIFINAFIYVLDYFLL